MAGSGQKEALGKVFGAVLVAVGALTAFLAVSRPEGLRAPAAVVYGAAALFVLAGAAELSRAMREPLKAVLLLGFGALSLWAALWPDGGVSSGGRLVFAACAGLCAYHAGRRLLG